MNDFKYQKKTNKSDDDLMAYKDFNKVLEKHGAISSSYKLVKKWAIISSAGLAIGAGTIFFNLNKEEEIIATSNPTEIAFTSNKATIIPTNNLIEEETPIVKENHALTSMVEVQEKEVVFEEKPTPKEQELKETQVVNENKDYQDSSAFKEQSFKPEVWYTVNEIPEKEKVKLPTLFVSKLAWPEKLTKTELVKFPHINALYKSVTREIPIVDGIAYITTNNSKQKENGVRLKGNNFPPALIRAIHKSDENSVLLLKDIKLFLPGKGYVNIGDKKIDIVMDRNYKKKLEQTKVIE